MPTPLPPNPPNRAWGIAPPEEPAPGSVENPIVVELDLGRELGITGQKDKPDTPKDPVSKLLITETGAPPDPDQPDVTTDPDRQSPDEDIAAKTADPTRRL